MTLKLSRHGMTYLPWWPHAKIVRTRGEINSTDLIVFWRGWVWEMEIRKQIIDTRPG